MTWQLTRKRMLADLQLANRSHSTIDQYLRTTDRFVAFCGRDLAHLGEAEVREFLLHQKTTQGYSPSSQRRVLPASAHESRLRAPYDCPLAHRREGGDAWSRSSWAR